jgi:hypothetical protein
MVSTSDHKPITILAYTNRRDIFLMSSKVGELFAGYRVPQADRRIRREPDPTVLPICEGKQPFAISAQEDKPVLSWYRRAAKALNCFPSHHFP